MEKVTFKEIKKDEVTLEKFANIGLGLMVLGLFIIKAVRLESIVTIVKAIGGLLPVLVVFVFYAMSRRYYEKKRTDILKNFSEKEGLEDTAEYEHIVSYYNLVVEGLNIVKLGIIISASMVFILAPTAIGRLSIIVSTAGMFFFIGHFQLKEEERRQNKEVQ